MKKRRIIGLACICLVVLGTIYWGVLGYVRTQQLEAADAALELPPTLARHQELVRALEARLTSAEPEQAPVDPCADELDRLAMATPLLEQIVALEFPPHPQWADSAEVMQARWTAYNEARDGFLVENAGLLAELHTLLACPGLIAVTDLEDENLDIFDEGGLLYGPVKAWRILHLEFAKSVEDREISLATRNVTAQLRLLASLRGTTSLVLEDLCADVLGNLTTLRYYIEWNSFPPGMLPDFLVALREARESLDLGAQYAAVQGFGNACRETWRQKSLRRQVRERGLHWGVRNWIWARPVCAPLYARDQIASQALLGQLSELCARPYFEVKSELERIEAEGASLSITLHSTRRSAQEAKQRAQAWATFQVQLDLFYIGLLLENEYAVHGVYPDTLGALEGATGSPLPIDPFTGEPYRYEPKDGYFHLYSPGDPSPVSDTDDTYETPEYMLTTPALAPNAICWRQISIMMNEHTMDDALWFGVPAQPQ